MAGAIGNQYATRARVWRDAIDRAIERRGANKTRAEALDALAEKLLAKCDEGDMAALKELGDRLDGKPTQMIGGDQDNPVRAVITWAIPTKS